jgi:hypothetical protein
MSANHRDAKEFHETMVCLDPIIVQALLIAVR